MRTKQITRILNKFERLWLKVPDQRFGQVFENYLLSNKSRGDKTSNELFHIEDDVYEKRLDGLLKKVKK
jgi:hypothetical protein